MALRLLKHIGSGKVAIIVRCRKNPEVLVDFIPQFNQREVRPARVHSETVLAGILDLTSTRL